MDQESIDLMDNGDEFSVGSNFCSDESDLENESSGNAFWADAMNKILNTDISKEKVILSKADKNSNAVKQAKQKHDKLVDEIENVKKTTEVQLNEVKSYEPFEKEILQKQKQIMSEQEKKSIHQENDDMMDNSDEFSVGSNLCSDESDLENESPGNASWADAMNKVLNTKISKEKFILSKARKDSDIVKQAKRKHEIELVDESGNVKKTTEIQSKEVKSYKALRKEMLEKQKQKAEWEAMCRVKPDVMQRERERELIRIATRGVVHLFNTVEKHQKGKKNEKEKNTKKKVSLGAVKGNFMDILKGQSKKQQSLEDDPVMKKVKQEETWNILKDDFMIGAEMKDWDKESDND